jgi:anaerobic selenocysteine-containing dehydrogenase
MDRKSGVEKRNEENIVKTVCNMCSQRCGINVYVEHGKITKVTGMQEHPFSTLCLKAQAIPELVHSSERLTNPLKKIDGRFREISWDEAFGFIADKLIDIKHRYGSKAVVVHVGVPFIATQTEKVIRRFTDLYGTPNYTTGSSFCHYARVMGYGLTLGTYVTANYSADTKCMVVWGKNPQEALPLEADAIYAMAARGTKLVVIDPRVTPLAEKADLYAQLRPGTDCAMALGLLNVIIAEEMYDKDFVQKWTVGFDKLAEHVERYRPEVVEKITWVPAQLIKKIAHTYATGKPASISAGLSLDHCTNGIQAIRAVAALMAITGNLDIPGGDTYVPGLQQTNLRLQEKVADDPPIGAEYPLFPKYTREQTVAPAIDGILTDKPYPMKALLISGCNPILTWPNTSKVIKAFEKLDLIVVADIFMTDTAKRADIVLPGSSFLERQDLRTYPSRGMTLVVRTEKAVDPVGNSKEDWKIWAELGKTMGYGEYFPWKDSDELFEHLLKSTNISLDRLKQNPGGVYYSERRFQKYLEEGFNTPSKKVELYSETMSGLGYDGIPNYHEPAESPVSRPDLFEKYPLVLTTGARTIAYQHSQYHNLPSLRRLVPEPLIEINPQTADSFGIADGDMVKVESLRGSIQLRARLTKGIHPGVVSIQHGWSEANVNCLTDDQARDPVSAYPGFRSELCRITKLTV